MRHQINHFANTKLLNANFSTFLNHVSSGIFYEAGMIKGIMVLCDAIVCVDQMSEVHCQNVTKTLS